MSETNNTSPNKEELVRNITLSCLYTDEELKALGTPPKDCVISKGVVSTFGFNPIKLRKHRQTIKWLLSEMSDDFHVNRGGGASFINLCDDRHGNLWGQHSSMEELICLGQALHLAAYLPPHDFRYMWNAMPGGVPYVIINLEGFDE